MNNPTNNAAGRFRTIAAVLVLLTRETKDGTEFLLQKRQNTGFEMECGTFRLLGM